MTVSASPRQSVPGATGRDRPPAKGYLEWARIAGQAFTLNALWLAGCLLIVTAPAATTALLAAIRRWRADSDPPTARQFVHDLRTCFWRDLAIGLLLGLTVAFFAVDLLIIGQMGTARRIVMIGWIGCAMVVALATVSVFVVAAGELTSSGRRSPIRTLRQSAVRALIRPVGSLLTVAVLVAVGLAVSFSPICLLGAGVAGAAIIDLIDYRRADHG